jgi:molecular chaperone DnaK
MPQIEVTFDIDANGILHVTAKDKATGKEQKIRIEASSGLSDKEIDKMVHAAEEHAADDKRRREEIETRNRLDALVYDVEKNSKEWSDKLEPAVKKRLEEAVEGAKKALRAGDADGIKKAAEALQGAYSEAGRSLYQSQTASSGAAPEEPAGGGATGGAGPESKKDEAVEADYEIVDDGKQSK